jgi:hypothetical protein
MLPERVSSQDALGRLLLNKIPDVCSSEGFVSLSVALMDPGDEVETLLSVGDADEGWRQICTIIRNFEREEIRSLAKPNRA